MKILTLFTLIGTLLNPITKPEYFNATNQTGNSSFNNFMQFTYSYELIDNTSYTGEISAGGWVGLSVELPIVCAINIHINFIQPIEVANVELYLTNALSGSTYYPLNYVGDHIYVIDYGYNYLKFKVTNTDSANLTLIYDIQELHEMYGYNNPNLQSLTNPYQSSEWVRNGSNYVDITSLYLKSCTLAYDIENDMNDIVNDLDDINSNMSNILTNIDGIEGYLSQIVTNTTYLSTIDTNINSIKNTLTTISTNLTTQFNVERLYTAIYASYNNRVDMPYMIFNGSYDQYVFSSNWPSTSTYKIIYDVNDTNYEKFDREKLKVVIEIGSEQFDCKYFYSNVPITNELQVNDMYWENQLYVYAKETNRVYRFVFYYQYNANQVKVSIRCHYSSLTNPTVWSQQSAGITRVFVTDANINNTQINYDILETLKSMDFSNIVIDTSDKSDVDNFFQTLKQSLQLPSMPQLTQSLEKMKYLTKYYVYLINDGRLIIYRNILAISGIFGLLGVLLL